MIPGESEWYIAGNGQLRRQLRPQVFNQDSQPRASLYPGHQQFNQPPPPAGLGHRQQQQVIRQVAPESQQAI